MRVVLDSNIILNTQFHFRTAHIAAVLAAAQPLHVEILIPEVVFLESCNLYHRELQEKADKYRVAASRLQDLLVDPLGHEITDLFFVANRVQEYRQSLEARLRSGGFRRLPIPDVEHRHIVNAAISKRKPFGGNDGYRDYLIWLSILDEVQSNPDDLPVYLISDNLNDFAADPKASSPSLHPDFAQDLLDRGLPADGVVYYRSTPSFRDTVINPRLDFLATVSEKVRLGKFESQDFYDYIPNAIGEWLYSKMNNVDIKVFGLDPEIEWIEFADVDQIDEYHHADVRALPNDELAIDLIVDATCSFHVEVDQNSDLGMEFTDAHFMVGHHMVSGVVSKTLKFIMTSLVGAAPSRMLMRMDAILLHEKQR